jgi:hypothetical protein
VSSTSSPGNHGVVRAVAWRRAAPTVPVRGGDGGRSGERARHHVPVAGGESTYSKCSTSGLILLHEARTNVKERCYTYAGLFHVRSWGI